MDELKAQAAPVAPAEATQAAPEKAPESTQADPRMEQLARRERALRQQSKAVQAEKQRLESESKRLRDEQGKYMSPDDWKRKFLQDPSSVGLSYDEIASRYLTQPSAEDQKMAALERKIAELEGKQSETVSKVTAAQEQAYQQAIKQLNREVSLLVDGNDAYETIKATGNQEAVVALIESTYKEDGILMTAEEASKQVEEYLMEEALRLAQLSKVRARLTPAQKAEEAQAPEAKTDQKPTITTLSRTVTQPSTKPLSAKEKRERAILAFQGKL